MPDAAPAIEVRGNQPDQHAFITDWRTGTTCASGGWGSGKTWAGARKLALIHRYNACPGMLVAPTWSDMTRLMLPELRNVASEWRWPMQVWLNGQGEKRYPHVMLLGRPLYLFTGEEPKSITGVEVGHCWADEAARLKHVDGDPLKSAPTQIRGRLRHPKAKLLHWLNTTTPEGTYTWIEEDFIKKPKDRHRIYFLRTSLNKAMRADAIKGMMAGIPPELVPQYLEGHAVNYTTHKAHVGFREAMHVDPAKGTGWHQGEVLVGCDFNVSPMCWVAGQLQADGTLVILDELVIANHAQVDAAVLEAEAKGWAGTRSGRRAVRVYPDQSAKNRSTTGDPEAVVLTNTAREQGWPITCNAFGVNPPVNSRINNVSRCLRDAAGRVRVRVHPRCEHLIRQLNTCGRLANGYDPGKDGKSGHILDALGYLIWHVFPVHGMAEAANWHL